MTPKEKYHELCKSESSIPIFSRDWWLDTVCGKANWDVLLAEEKDKVIAAFPFYKRGRQVISMPPYTQTMGLWFAPVSEDTKYVSALSARQRICLQFIKELDKYPIFLQNFHHGITDWLPFYWYGYRQTTRYTYILHGIRKVDRLWEQMAASMRRNIVKARERYQIKVRPDIPIEDFIKSYTLTFSRQGGKPDHIDTLVRLIEICIQRNQGRLWGGYDAEGRLHAAAFVVWQESSAYYLAGGSDPSLRGSGAQSLVLWNTLLASSAYTDTFDFEGSMLQGVERFFHEFGAIQTPYFTISKGKLSLYRRVRLKLNI